MTKTPLTILGLFESVAHVSKDLNGETAKLFTVDPASGRKQYFHAVSVNTANGEIVLQAAPE